MPLPDIQLDDRRFEDLVAELRRRIPAYTPEWTDHNESDPGITLIELFAWLEDILLWRLNRIPDKAFIKFLQLIGIELTPPQPAQAELTFKLASKDLPFAVAIDQGTRATLASSSGGAVIFETTENLYAVGADLVAVQAFDGARYQVVTELNRVNGKSFYPFSPAPQQGAALYLGFDRAFSEGAFQYFLTIHVDTYGDATFVQGADPGATNVAPPVLAVWEYWSGDTTQWKPVTVANDGTNALTRSGVVLFDPPAGFVFVKYGALKKSDDAPLFWLRYRIDQVLGSGYEVAPRINEVLVNTVSAINAVTEEGELLGASSGMPNQTFQISHAPILPKDPSVKGIIEVDEGEGFQLWTEARDFAGSDRTSTHYTLNYSTGEVRFGDGELGKIPQWLSADGSNREPADVPNIRVTRYRWGAGAQGNAGANTITGLERAIPFVDSMTNLLPSSGGADEESLQSAQERAPLTIRTLSRAVTADDFAFLARQTPGAHIGRAVALPLHRPEAALVRPATGTVAAAEVPMPGVVTVIVVPDVPEDLVDPQPKDRKPEPSEDTLKAVAKWLDQHRLVTCELYVTGPRYRQVEIQARIIVDRDADSGKVREALQAGLLAYFHPLTGGQKGTGWGFGQPIYLSETYGQILEVPGVERIDGAVTTYVDGKVQPPDQDVILQPNEVVCSLTHTLDVRYAT